METRQGEDVGVNEGGDREIHSGVGGEVDKVGQNGGVENTPRLLSMTGDTTLITWFTKYLTVRPQSWSAPSLPPPLYHTCFAGVCGLSEGCHQTESSHQGSWVSSQMVSLEEEVQQRMQVLMDHTSSFPLFHNISKLNINPTQQVNFSLLFRDFLNHI